MCTSFEERSKVLPPIVKEIIGIEAMLPQSTSDSPSALGSFSQTCQILYGLLKSSFLLAHSVPIIKG